MLPVWRKQSPWVTYSYKLIFWKHEPATSVFEKVFGISVFREILLLWNFPWDFFASERALFIGLCYISSPWPSASRRVRPFFRLPRPPPSRLSPSFVPPPLSLNSNGGDGCSGSKTSNFTLNWMNSRCRRAKSLRIGLEGSRNEHNKIVLEINGWQFNQHFPLFGSIFRPFFEQAV